MFPTRAHAAVLSLLTLCSLACSRGEEGAVPLFLLAPSEAVPSSGGLWIPFRSGWTLPGDAVQRLDHSFDPLFFRIGGEQWSLLPGPVGDAGAYGLRLRLGEKQRGDAMIGFSTRPRELAASEGGPAVRISRHVKLLFHIGRDRSDLPVASPALTARFGLKLEFVPLIDPLPLEPGAELPLRLRFDGPGLPRASVNVQFLPSGGGQESIQLAQRKSDAEGHFVLPIHAPGIWHLRAVHEVELPGGIVERHLAELVFRTGEE